jgi:hypothetical protein
MKEYYIEYYNNTLKMWGERTIIADSPMEAMATLTENPDYMISIISVKEKED